MKRPAFQFYPADWRKDLELGACGYVARGIWFEMLCIMHEAQPYGHMVRDGRAIPDQSAANLLRVPLKAYRAALQELEENGVFSRTADGTIYSRRMVKDERLRETRAEGGKAGGEHGQKGAQYGAQGGRPRKEEEGKKPPLQEEQKPPLYPPPSASSASSSASSASALFSHAVERTPNEDARANGSHGRGERARNGKTVESWSTPAWVAATAATLGLTRRNGEQDEDFADRVHSEVDARRRKAASDARRHA